MNKQIHELDRRAWQFARETCPNYHGISKVYSEKFAELIIKDVITVVAAHALTGDSAVQVFANLKRIYEDDQPPPVEPEHVDDHNYNF